MMMPFVIGRPSSIRALEHALGKDKRIFLAAQHDAAPTTRRAEDIFTMGCVANVVQSLKLPDSNIKVLVEGVDRARVIEWKEDKGFYRVVVKVLQRQKDAAGDVEQTMSRVVTLFEQYVKLSNNLHYDAMIAAVRSTTRASWPTPSPRTCWSASTRSRTCSKSSRRSNASTASPASSKPKSTSSRSIAASSLASRSRWRRRRRSTTSTRR